MKKKLKKERSKWIKVYIHIICCFFFKKNKIGWVNKQLQENLLLKLFMLAAFCFLVVFFV